MIPCPVCLVVLDGAGGVCRAHQELFHCRLWFPGEWPIVEELSAAVDQAGGTQAARSDRLTERLATSRHTWFERARAVVERAGLPKLRGEVFVGFRHFRPTYADDREHYSHGVESLILPALIRNGRFAGDQVHGIAHLFYSLADGPIGPETPIEPGIQLVLVEKPE